MTIKRNSARCDSCGVEIVSTHGHDFKVHWCPKNPKPALEWVGNKLQEKVPPEITWNFAVDGGQEYLRRVGTGWTDTSIGDE